MQKPKWGLDSKVRKSARIMNAPKKGPKRVEHIDLTSVDEYGGDHSGILGNQNATQQSQSGPSSPPVSTTHLHAGIIEPPLPPLPSGHIKRNGKHYLTLSALKKLKEEERNNKFMPPRPNN